MKYSNIRTLLEADKRSKQNDRTEYTEYGEFAVCIDSAGSPFLVDSDVAKLIANRKWCRSNGYPCANIGGKIVRLHDCVMAIRFGEKPLKSYVDHINQDKSDNRSINLRFVSPQASALNMPLRSNNTSGVKGVSHTKNGRYRAYITANGKWKALGTYDTVGEAKEARKNAELKYGYL